MTYRTITVSGVDYEYVIGKSCTKIKGFGVFQNNDIGVESRYSNRPKDVEGNRIKKMVVTPAIVADLIAGNPIRSMNACRHGTVTGRTTADPYEAEVNDEYAPIIDCDKCVHESYMET